MGQAIPNQHPAVVLRSHFNVLRALLVAALVAVIGLTVALVIVATDEEQAADTPAAVMGDINYGGFNPATGKPESLDTSRAQTATRTDGGPEESAVAATIGSEATTSAMSGPDEARTAASIGLGADASTAKSGGVDEAKTAAAVGWVRDAAAARKHGPDESAIAHEVCCH